MLLIMPSCSRFAWRYTLKCGERLSANMSEVEKTSPQGREQMRNNGLVVDDPGNLSVAMAKSVESLASESWDYE